MSDKKNIIPKYKSNIFWLTLLSYLLLIFTLAHPVWIKKINTYTILLDRSASMTTRSNLNKSVYEAAIERIRKLLTSFKADDFIRLVVFPKKQIIEGNKTIISSFLDNCKCTHLIDDISEVIATEDFTKKSGIFVVSDGTQEILIPKAQYFFVGNKNTDNVGITTFSSELISPTKSRIFYSIKNFSSKSQNVPIKIRGNKEILKVEKYNFKPQETYSNSIIILNKKIEYIEIILERNDNLKIDNKLIAFKRKATNIWIENSHKKTFISLFEKIPGIKIQPNINLSTNVAFITKRTTKKIPQLVLLNCILPLMKRKKMVNATPLYYNSHPLLSYVFPNISIRHAFPLRSLTEKSLIDTKEGAILALGKKYLYIGFDIQQSNWPKLPSFAIFWINYFDYFFPNRNNFSYKLTNEKQPVISFKKNEAYNYISYSESDNVGKFTENTPKNILKKEISFSMRNLLIILSIVFLLILWFRNFLNTLYRFLKILYVQKTKS